jgi:acyl-CoA synthetase (AMP-forming)/AMP-acid ligase II
MNRGEWHDWARGEVLSGSEIRRRVMAKVEELRDRGLRPGQLTIIRESAPVAFTVNYIAAGLLGTVLLPMERGLAADEEERRIAVTDPAAILSGPDVQFREVTGNRAELPPDVAQILFTGGSTGSPKAVMHTARGLVSNIAGIVEWTRLDHNDRILGTLPLFHCYGINWTAIAPLLTGASVDAFGRLSASAIAEAGIAPTAWPTVPAAVEVVLRSPAAQATDWSGLRFCLVGGAPSADDLSERFRALTGRPVLNGYGVTEATSFVCAPDLDDFGQGPGDIGRPVGEVTFRSGARHDGLSELELGGPSVMAGYLGDPQATAAAITCDGWLRTGDLFEVTDRGTLALRGRLKAFINRGGEKVDPGMVAAAINRHAAVHDAFVLGVPDELLGEVVACVVEAEPGTTEQDILEFARSQLAAYAVPVVVRLVESLPRNPAGKVIPTQARELLDAARL